MSGRSPDTCSTRSIPCPSLRERREDIPLLVHHLVGKYSARIGKQIEVISQKVIDALQTYDWPGNVRELENVIERALILSRGRRLVTGDWLPQRRIPARPSAIATLEELQRAHILKVLELTGGRVSREQGAAKALAINPKTLHSRMKKLGIGRQR